MNQKVLETIRKYNLIVDGDKIVLGVSGGPDSICMLDNLREVKEEQIIEFEIYVAHINHMIREEAIDDEKYVQEYCKKYNIECFVKRADVQKIASEKKIGTEEAGRKVRYDFFEEVLQKTESNKIAIAHNKNDKIETIIMHLLRGSGLSGLKGIEPIRDNKYIRPLLECERTEIEQYCEDKKLNPRIDKTNFENEYTRNKIRNIVIPYIKKEFNPNIIQTLSRLSDLAADESNYIELQTQKAFEKILIAKEKEQITLNLKEFNKQDKVIKNRLILYTTKELMGSTQGIEKIHIEDIIKLCQNNVGNKFLTPNKNLKVLVKDKKIFFIKQNTYKN
ncbi:tRNA(Ile)-lysidine synthase [Clostridium sp. CAG:356]|nr:MAG: tRNA lysidine(34) synthetase TilS [Clostridium sp. 28_12]CDD37140.1 tRNA(Ile)-lysidine synthase [Clostridium sp. CAG:356]